MTRTVVGVDIGTTSTKAVVFVASGKRLGATLGVHAVEYPLAMPEPGAAEQDPDRIHAAVLAAIRGALLAATADPQRVSCIAFSAAMHVR